MRRLIFIVFSCCLLAADFTGTYLILLPERNADISEEQLKQIFLGQTQYWPNGEQVRVLLPDDDRTRRRFIREFLGQDERYFDQVWARARVRDFIQPPRNLPSEVITSAVATYSGYLGVISATALPEQRGRAVIYSPK